MAQSFERIRKVPRVLLLIFDYFPVLNLRIVQNNLRLRRNKEIFLQMTLALLKRKKCQERCLEKRFHVTHKTSKFRRQRTARLALTPMRGLSK